MEKIVTKVEDLSDLADFDEGGLSIYRVAIDEARHLGHPILDNEHVFLGLVSNMFLNEDCFSDLILRRKGSFYSNNNRSLTSARATVIKYNRSGTQIGNDEVLFVSPDLVEVLTRSTNYSAYMGGQGVIGPSDILYPILDFGEGVVNELLRNEYDLSLASYREEISELVSGSSGG